MRRTARILGILLVVAGLGTLAWTIAVWRWEDPFTALYTHYEQHRLAASLNKEFAVYADKRAGAGETIAAEQHRLTVVAGRFRREVREGQAIGRIIVPRVGLNVVLVNGTDHDTLEKGPGRDPRTFMPGHGQLVDIAGHRTTCLTPFSHIDRLRKGERSRCPMRRSSTR
jgi:sortase A